MANLGRLLDCRVVIDGGDAAATDFLDDMAQSVVSRRGLHGEVRVEALRGNGGHCFGLQPKVHYAFDAGDEIVVPRMNSYSDFNATRGSILVARRAGAYAAKRAVITSTELAAIRLAGSVGRIP